MFIPRARKLEGMRRLQRQVIGGVFKILDAERQISERSGRIAAFETLVQCPRCFVIATAA